jgi:transposase
LEKDILVSCGFEKSEESMTDRAKRGIRLMERDEVTIILRVRGRRRELRMLGTKEVTIEGDGIGRWNKRREGSWV